MRPPCETVQRDFLPDLRVVLAKKLRDHGLSQTDIAAKLELTQAAVSKYLAREDDVRLVADVGDAASRIEALILSGAPADRLVDQVCSTCMQSRIGGGLCRLHRERVDSLDRANCQICVHLLGGRDVTLAARASVLRDMEHALRRIESFAGFASIMPQVRANLVSCGDGATSTEDVAAVPGRITMIDDRARALVPPQFGASSHTAQILLSAIKKWPKVRSCFCISGREEVALAARRVGFSVLRLKEPAANSGTIGSAIQSGRGPPKNTVAPAVHIPGGIGVEPVLYLFSASASKLADMCQEIIDILSKEAP